VKMSTRNWGDLWDLLIALMSREPIFVEIMFWLGVAFLAVMVLEGLRSSFFPKRTTEAAPSASAPSIEGADEPMTLAQAQSHIPANMAEESAASVPVASRQIYQTIDRSRVFRSSPRQTRILGTRKQPG